VFTQSRFLLIAGPSGAGKSVVAKEFEWAYAFAHIDIDQDVGRTHGFELNGLPAEWHKDISVLDFNQLMMGLRNLVTEHGQRGAVISIPTSHVFTADQLDTAFGAGLSPVLLWGTEEQCIEARRMRSKVNRKRFNDEDVERFRRKNRKTFDTYSRSEYDQYRIEMFRPNGGPHWPVEHNVAAIIQLLGWSISPKRNPGPH
jgi:hypothetical protein